ncbi:MAG: hypothetical protein ACXADB_05570 [Candidatus Hermodarchaeia archaeon]
MIVLRPNTTHRFTLCGDPVIGWRDPPPALKARGYKPRRRYTMPVMPDDSIFFDELDVGNVIFEKIIRAILDGEFKNGRRFEIRVNDMSEGPANYYQVRPLEWKANPPTSLSCERACEGCYC